MAHASTTQAVQERRSAFSIMELLAVVTILGVLSAILITRTSSHIDGSKREACFLRKGEVELQVQLWHRNTGSLPPANLSGIGTDTGYFPEGLPVCPVDGTAYTIDTTTGKVTGHSH